MLIDHLTKRGATWYVRGRNSVGVAIDRHSTKCSNRQAAARYAMGLEELTAEEWEKRKVKVGERTNPAANPTLTEALKDWLKDYDDSDEGESTKEQYRRVIERTHIEKGPLADYGIVFLRAVASDHLRDLQLSWVNAGYAYNTIKGYRDISNAMFEHFYRKGVLEKNPWLPVKTLGKKKKPSDDQILRRDAGDDGRATMPLDLDESDRNWQRIKLACVPFILSLKAVKRALLMRPESFLALLELMYETGLRRSDAILFRPDWIERDENGFSYRCVQKKSKTMVSVFLPDELARKLRALPLLPWRGAKDRPGAGMYPFWDGSCKNRNYYLHSNLNLPLRALGKHLGFSGEQSLHPHRFRDSFAVNTRNLGIPLEEVSLLLGHKNIQITQEYYAPNVPSRQKHLANRLRAARAQAEEAKMAPPAARRKNGRAIVN